MRSLATRARLDHLVSRSLAAALLGVALGAASFVAAGCGGSDPAPGVAVLTDTGGGDGPDAVGLPDGGPPDVRVEVRACETDEACKGAFGAPPLCQEARCVDGVCALAAAGDGAPCGVDDPCWVDAACAGGECVGARLDCNDGNPCTADDCDAVLGCFYQPADGTCDDHKPWTTDDHCDGGVCVGVTGPCQCESDADCPDDDGDACTGVPSCRECVCVSGAPVVCDTSADSTCARTRCEPSSGDCVREGIADGLRCDDDSRCSEDDRCSEGQCVGTPRDCDDQNPCTNDSCDARAGCLHFENMATCDDGDACTRNDACVDGYCLGTRRSCDDGDPCTADTCDPGEGCVSAPISGAACDDRFACTEDDVCQDGVCIGGPNVCACETDGDCVRWGDGDLCHGTLTCVEVDEGARRCLYDPAAVVVCPRPPEDGCVRFECEPESGVCEPLAYAEGLACDDGDACTTGDRCEGGACVGGAVACDDGNPCTDDRCDPDRGCVFTPNADPCDDGNPCTVQTVCSHGTCGGGAPRTCDDGEACTLDTCTVADGCVHEPRSGACDDGDACTAGDACKDGRCAGGTGIECVDGLPCTADACDPASGCVFTPTDGAACDDHDPCTTRDVCEGRDCVGQAPLACDDENPCTTDVCTPGVGCVFTPATGVPCDDGDPCTDDDACQGGVCTGGAVTCDCTTDVDCGPLEDGDRCNGTLVCDTATAPFRCVVDPDTIVVCDASGDTVCRKNRCQPDTGACAPVAVREGQPCDDGDACTSGDVCHGGDCEPGAAVTCDDGESCTDDACDPDDGCRYTPNADACEDGDACTDGDRCEGGACVSGAPVGCDDGEVCTTDRCDPQDGCVHQPVDEPCDDGDACTTGDACSDGVCVGGPAPDCDDGNECTTDSCAESTGCVNEPRAGDCDDGNPCTTGDVCADGVCTYAARVDCDDGNPCTADRCTDTGACENPVLPYGTPCDDGDAETISDQCDLGAVCTGWLRGEVARAGATDTILTDVAHTRFVATLTQVDAVHVTGSDRVEGQRWTWVGELAQTTLFVDDQFQGDVLTDVSYRAAVGEGGLVVRHDGARWREVNELTAALDLPASAELDAVHAYWTRQLFDTQAPTAETYYFGGVDQATGAPLLVRCHWTALDFLPVLGWSCAPGTLPRGGAIDQVWGTRDAMTIGADYTDGRAWAAQLPGTDTEVGLPGVVLSTTGSGTAWTSAAPAGCSAQDGTACAGATWRDLSGRTGQLWAVGDEGRLMRHTGLGWFVAEPPATALWDGTTLAEYDFRAVRVSTTRGVHLAGEWQGCLDGACGAGQPTHKRLFYLHYDPSSDRWDGVRELLLARCPGPAGGADCPAGWLDRYQIVAMESVEGDHPELIVVGNRPIAAAGGDPGSVGLVFHLHAD